MINKLKTTRGFTLPEILIGISVLVLAIMTATSLVVSIIRSNKANMNDLTAYYLASEGLEAVRNIRDTEWLNNLEWTGDKNFDFWSSNGVPIDFADGGKYIISRKPISVFGSQGLPSSGQSVLDLKNVAPWVVTAIGDTDISTRSVLELTDGGQFVHSEHLSLLIDLNKISQFRRYVEIEPKKDLLDEDVVEILVRSVVEWNESGHERDLILETVLSNWKAGPS